MWRGKVATSEVGAPHDRVGEAGHSQGVQVAVLVQVNGLDALDAGDRGRDDHLLAEVAAADLDGDGDDDIIFATSSSLAWIESLSNGAFGAPQPWAGSLSGLYDVQTADLDGDGDLEVVSASQNIEQFFFYENFGGGNFGPQQFVHTTVRCIINICIADLDGDADGDVLFASQCKDEVAWHENLTPTSSEVLGAGCAGLSLSGNPMRLDSSWDLQLGSVAATSPFGVFFVGGAALEPGVPLTATCTAYTTADLGFFLQPVVAGASTWSLAVPNDPSLVGAQLTVQGTAASADPAAWNGIALSNGLRGTVGQ